MKQPNDQNAVKTPYGDSLTICLLLYALGIAGYFILRYGAQQIAGDAVSLTRAIESMREQGALQPGGRIYPHGFNYQVVSLFLLLATGLIAQTLQNIVYLPLAIMILGLTSLALFTQATQDRRIAVLATLFLLLQPDMLFVTMRGSHEKLTWPLMIVALTLLYRSVGPPLRVTLIYIGLFYLTVFAMIATNAFFASSFLTAVLISLFLGLAMARFLRCRQPKPSAGLERLTYISLSGAVLVFTFMTYIYPPASSELRVLKTAVERLSALLLNFEVQSQPYEYISYGWVSREAYLWLSGFSWFLVITSLTEWLWRGKRILDRRETFGLRESLDWLLYAGFSIQIALSIVVDFAGVLSSNLQLRVFPGFTVIAVEILARAVGRILSSRSFRGWARSLTFGLTGLGVVWFALASVFKATNEPMMSNKWMFYSRSENDAIQWTDSHLRGARIWTGTDGRLREVFFFHTARSQNQNVYDAFKFQPTDRYILFSERDRLRGTRAGVSMPPVSDLNRVYDNGDVQLYHKRARTPYQR